MKHQKMNRILAAALSAACLVPFAAMVPVDADAADIMSALEITQEMGLGFNIGNSLDSTGYGNYDDITSFEKSYGNPAVTKEMVDTIKAKGFDSVRIPTMSPRPPMKTAIRSTPLIAAGWNGSRKLLTMRISRTCMSS